MRLEKLSCCGKRFVPFICLCFLIQEEEEEKGDEGGGGRRMDVRRLREKTYENFPFCISSFFLLVSWKISY